MEHTAIDVSQNVYVKMVLNVRTYLANVIVLPAGAANCVTSHAQKVVMDLIANNCANANMVNVVVMTVIVFVMLAIKVS